MRSRGLVLPVIVLYLCGIALGIAGVVFLAEAVGPNVSEGQIRNAMAGGITCLALGSVLVVIASVMAFLSAHLVRLQQPPKP